MPEPKKQSSPRKTGLRRSHLRLELARRVNKTSPVKVFETKKKMERVIVNPSTGQRMLVPPKLVLNFKPNQTWKDKLKGGR